MPTDKKKKNVKVRDLKPAKDAKGGGGFRAMGSTRSRESGAGRSNTSRSQSGAGRF